MTGSIVVSDPVSLMPASVSFSISSDASLKNPSLTPPLPSWVRAPSCPLTPYPIFTYYTALLFFNDLFHWSITRRKVPKSEVYCLSIITDVTTLPLPRSPRRTWPAPQELLVPLPATPHSPLPFWCLTSHRVCACPIRPGVGKLWLAGHIPPNTCFCTTHKLMDFTFLNGF